MSYENAVPKPLKFLVSDGKLVDDARNVIAESESLKDLYTKWNPEIKKYLLSDGSVVDENNNLIIKNDYYKKMYNQADPKIAKYLHSDGTIDENSGSGGGADLEDNKTATIDVSTYTEPVEITPTAGKDGMKKATVTLSNIPSPSGGDVTFYAWYGDFTLYTLSQNPQPGDIAYEIQASPDSGTIPIVRLSSGQGNTTVIKSVTENGIVIEHDGADYELLRDDSEYNIIIPKSST